MAITISQPSMVLNAPDAPGAYEMTKTMSVPTWLTAQQILSLVRQTTLAAPGGRFLNLIINCHGYYSGNIRTFGPFHRSSGSGGYGLSLGTGLVMADVPAFGMLREPINSGRPLIDDIIITACGTARISALNASGNGDGNSFVAAIARATGCNVTAATTQQVHPKTMPRFQIDNWEGLVLKYGPAGNIIWSNDYGRGLVTSILYGCN